MDYISHDRIYSLSDISKFVNNKSHNHEIITILSQNFSFDEKILPLRFDALLIILCTNGSGSIEINLKKYKISKNTLIILHPKNFLSEIKTDSDFSAEIVACSLRVVNDVLPKLSDMLPVLLHYRTNPIVSLSNEQTQGLNEFFSIIQSKLSVQNSPFLYQKILCILQAALFEMMEIQTQNSPDNIFGKTRKEQIMAKFILSVSDNYKTTREVTFYANDLCITPKHLSAVIKDLTGMTAGEWIERFVTLEAKMLLKTTDLTIKQISSTLNFANQSFFGKYFKHQTGISPSDFRKKS